MVVVTIKTEAKRNKNKASDGFPQKKTTLRFPTRPVIMPTETGLETVS